MTLRRALSLLVATTLGVIGLVAPPASAATPVTLTVSLQSYLGGPVSAYPGDLWINSQTSPAVPGGYSISINGRPYASGSSHSGYYGRLLDGPTATAGPLTIEVSFWPSDTATYESVTTTEVFQRPKGTRGHGRHRVAPVEREVRRDVVAAVVRRCGRTTDQPQPEHLHDLARRPSGAVRRHHHLRGERPGPGERQLPGLHADQPRLRHRAVAPRARHHPRSTGPRVGDLVEVRAAATFQGDPVQTVGIVSLSGGGTGTVTEPWPVAGTWEKSVRVTSTEPLRLVADVQPRSDHRLSAATLDESTPVRRGLQQVRADQPAAPYVGQSWTPTSTGDGAVFPTVAVMSDPGVCQVTSGARVDFTGIGNCVVDVSAAATTVVRSRPRRPSHDHGRGHPDERPAGHRAARTRRWVTRSP